MTESNVEAFVRPGSQCFTLRCFEFNVQVRVCMHACMCVVDRNVLGAVIER